MKLRNDFHHGKVKSNVEERVAEGLEWLYQLLETMQFLLAGGQFLMDEGLFDFSEQEILERRIVLQEILEKSLGAESGTFDFMNQDTE